MHYCCLKWFQLQEFCGGLCWWFSNLILLCKTSEGFPRNMLKRNTSFSSMNSWHFNSGCFPSNDPVCINLFTVLGMVMLCGTVTFIYLCQNLLPFLLEPLCTWVSYVKTGSLCFTCYILTQGVTWLSKCLSYRLSRMARSQETWDLGSRIYITHNT